MPPENLFMDPFAGPAALGSPAFPDSAAPAVEFAAPPMPEGFDDEPLTELEIPFRPQPSMEQRPSRQRSNREGRTGGRGDGRGRRVT